jgi:hypothetical protein
MAPDDPASNDTAAAVQALQAQVQALSATLKSVLTTLVLRGLLNKAEVAALLQETENALQGPSHPAALGELKAIEQDMPAYLRAAVGPAPDPDEDDH